MALQVAIRSPEFSGTSGDVIHGGGPGALIGTVALPDNFTSQHNDIGTFYQYRKYFVNVTQFIATGDIKPPVLSNLTVSGITSSGAYILWDTDEFSTSVVNYGTTTNYGLSASGSSALSGHIVSLTGLAEGTTYEFEAVSVDLSGNPNSLASNFLTLDIHAPIISGISSGDISSGSATISWLTNELSTSVVRYGLTTGLGSIESTSSFVINHSIGITGLDDNTQYFFSVSSVDQNNNTGTSGIFNFTTIDGTAPVISNIFADPSIDFAIITWNTNESGSSQVDYGVTTSFGSTVGPSLTFQTGHLVLLSGLSSSTLYYYKLSSRDVIGNLTTTGNTGELSFTTDVQPIGISNINATNVTASGFQATWNTIVASNSVVNLGNQGPFIYNLPSQGLTGAHVTGHFVQITGLSGNTRYDYQLSSTTGSLTEVTTTSLFIITLDNIPPVISNQTTSNITTNSVSVAFSTNELATGSVVVATGLINTPYTGYVQKIASSVFNTIHGTTVSNLLPSTQYRWFPIVKDTSQNAATGVQVGFTTNTLNFGITNVAHSGLNGSTERFTWNTLIPSTSAVEYGLTTSYGTIYTGQTGLFTGHTTIVSGLSPSTIYHARVKSSSGQFFAVGNDIVFTTVDDVSPIISNVGIGVESKSATITWNTNELATGRVDYGLTTGYGQSEYQSNFLASHTAFINNLAFNTSYHFRILATDQAGNTTTGTDNVFTTNNGATLIFYIFNIDITNVTSSGALVTWSTNDPADSRVRYAIELPFTESFYDPTFVTSHSIQMSGLLPNNVYNIRVVSDNGPLVANSDIFTINTLDNTPPVFISVEEGTPREEECLITWEVNEPVGRDIQWGPTLSYGTQSLKAFPKTTSLSYLIEGLIPDTQYFYKITAEDAQGNSSFTGDATTYFTTEPIVIDVEDLTVSNITPSGATIFWTTSHTASSVVDYGLTSGIYTGSQGNPNANVGNHTVNLSGLNQFTTYHARVKSIFSGFTGKPYTGLSDDFFFTTTDATAPIISNIGITHISPQNVRVTWDTNEPANDKIEWGAFGTYTSGSITVSGTYTTGHSKTLGSLTPSTQYFYKLTCADVSNNTIVSGGINNNFTTSGVLISITNLSVNNITASGASVQWITDLPGNSIVDYGLTSSYTHNKTNTPLVTVHGVNLTGLTGNTLYHYRAKSVNGSIGASGETSDLTFNTLDGVAPIITGLTTALTGVNTASIQWTTNELATTTVEYGPTISYGLTGTKGPTVFEQSHFITISPLSGNTLYHYRARSKDQANNETISSDKIFTTLSSTSGASNFNDGDTVAVIEGYYNGWNPFYVSTTIPLVDENDLDDSINFTIDEDQDNNICQVEIVKRDSEDKPLMAELISQVNLASPPASGAKVTLTVKATSSPKPAASTFVIPQEFTNNVVGGLGLRLTMELPVATDRAAFIGDFNQKIIKDGHLCKQYRYYSRLNQTIGCHAYFTYFKNDPTILLDLRISNGHINPDPASGAKREALGRVYFDSIYLTYPTGYEITSYPVRPSMLKDNANSKFYVVRAEANQQMFAPFTMFTRRLAIYPLGGDQNRAKLEALLGRLYACRPGGLRSYHLQPGYLVGGLRVGELTSQYITAFNGVTRTGYDAIEMPAKDWLTNGVIPAQATGTPASFGGSGTSITGTEIANVDHGPWQPTHSKAQGPTGAPNVRPWPGSHLSVYMARIACLTSQNCMERMFGFMFLSNGEYASIEAWDAFYTNGIPWNFEENAQVTNIPYVSTGTGSNITTLWNSSVETFAWSCPYEGTATNTSFVWFDNNTAISGDNGFTSLDWQHYFPAMKHEPVVCEMANDAMAKDNIAYYSEMACHGILAAFKQNGFGGGALLNKTNGLTASIGTKFGRDYSPILSLVLHYAYGDDETRTRKAWTLQRLVEVITFTAPPGGVLDRRASDEGGNTLAKNNSQWPGVDYWSKPPSAGGSGTGLGKYEFATYQVQYIESALWGVTELYLKNRWITKPTVTHPNIPTQTKTVTQQQYNTCLQRHIAYAKNFFPPDPLGNPTAPSYPLVTVGSGKLMTPTWAVRMSNSNFGTPAQVWGSNASWPGQYPQIQNVSPNGSGPTGKWCWCDPLPGPGTASMGLYAWWDFIACPALSCGPGQTNATTGPNLDRLHGWHQFAIGAIADNRLNGTPLNSANPFLNGALQYIESRPTLAGKLQWMLNLGDGIKNGLAGNMTAINFTENGASPWIGETQRALAGAAEGEGEQVRNLKVYITKKSRAGQVLIASTKHYFDHISGPVGVYGDQSDIVWLEGEEQLVERPEFKAPLGFSNAITLYNTNAELGGNVTVGTEKEYAIPFWVLYKIEETEVNGGTFEFRLGFDAEQDPIVDN